MILQLQVGLAGLVGFGSLNRDNILEECNRTVKDI